MATQANDRNVQIVLTAFDTLFNKNAITPPPSASGLPTTSSTAHTFRPDVKGCSN